MYKKIVKDTKSIDKKKILNIAGFVLGGLGLGVTILNQYNNHLEEQISNNLDRSSVNSYDVNCIKADINFGNKKVTDECAKVINIDADKNGLFESYLVSKKANKISRFKGEYLLKNNGIKTITVIKDHETMNNLDYKGWQVPLINGQHIISKDLKKKLGNQEKAYKKVILAGNQINFESFYTMKQTCEEPVKLIKEAIELKPDILNENSINLSLVSCLMALKRGSEMFDYVDKVKIKFM
ncbi:hypothetical protein ACFL1H_07605 [Nanoarchaeota archaeon]